MAKISSYSTTTPVLTDKLIGTDVGGTPADATKNFLLSDVQTLFKSGIALSDVLAAGNTATANIILTGDITATNLIALTAVTGTTITASGTVNGATVTATGDVNAVSVRTSNLQKTPAGLDIQISLLPIFADQEAAVLGGLATDGIYKTLTGELRIVV